MKFVYSEKRNQYGLVFNREKDFILVEDGRVRIVGDLCADFLDTDNIPEEKKNIILSMLELAYQKADLMNTNEINKSEIDKLRKKADIILKQTIINELKIDELNALLMEMAKSNQLN